MQDNEDTSVEEKWLNLKGKLTELAEKFVPKGKVSENSSWKIKGNFPIDANTRDAIRNKTRTYRAWKRTHPGNDRDAARQKYTKARNKAKSFLHKAKRLFEKGTALQSKSNPKAFWAHTRKEIKDKMRCIAITRGREGPGSF